MPTTILSNTPYTWDTAPGTWDDLESGDDFDTYGVTEYLREDAETLTWAEALSNVFTAIKTEALSWVEDFDALFSVILNETLTISESLSTFGNFVASIFESLTFTEIKEAILTRIFGTETVSFDETYSSLPEKVSAETLTITEVSTRLLTWVRELAETLTISEVKEIDFTKAFEVTITFIEALAFKAVAALSNLVFSSNILSYEDFLAYAQLQGPVGYGEFTRFIPADYDMKSVVLKLDATRTSTQENVTLNEGRLRADVPDVRDKATTVIASAAADTVIDFNQFFLVAPDVSITAWSGSAFPARPVIIAVTRTNFTVALRKLSDDTRTTGTISWIAEGY